MNAEQSSQTPETRSRCSKLAAFYRGLSPREQRGLWVLVVLELILIVAAQRDIQRRAAADIRGPKLLWRVIATQNLVGPLAYYVIGRKASK
jgi:hypothetical protein